VTYNSSSGKCTVVGRERSLEIPGGDWVREKHACFLVLAPWQHVICVLNSAASLGIFHWKMNAGQSS